MKIREKIKYSVPLIQFKSETMMEEKKKRKKKQDDWRARKVLKRARNTQVKQYSGARINNTQDARAVSRTSTLSYIDGRSYLRRSDLLLVLPREWAL